MSLSKILEIVAGLAGRIILVLILGLRLHLLVRGCLLLLLIIRGGILAVRRLAYWKTLASVSQAHTDVTYHAWSRSPQPSFSLTQGQLSAWSLE